jgi:hypothetical protein
MSTFQLEVGGKCNNGAVILSLWCDDVDGVVLAHYHGEYVTWLFNTTYQSSTTAGHYFRYGDGNQDVHANALNEAKRDFVSRVANYI